MTIKKKDLASRSPNPSPFVESMSYPTPSPLPQTQENLPGQSKATSENPKSPSLTPSPLLRIHLDDVSHPATKSFLSLVDATKVLTNSIDHTVKNLYPSPPLSHLREVRSVTLVLRSYGGLAETHGIALDDSHKEIHFNLDYIRDCAKDDSRRRDEIIGVIQHEMVHCFQHHAQGTAPSGLIEGVADYVRLQAGLAPPHWDRAKVGEKWDAGYQVTAFFLEWLAGTYGRESVARINEALRDVVYSEEIFWRALFKKDVKSLWNEYCVSREDKGTQTEDGGGQPAPTCA